MLDPDYRAHIKARDLGFKETGGINWTWYVKPYSDCSVEDLEFAMFCHCHMDNEGNVAFRIHN